MAETNTNKYRDLCIDIRSSSRDAKYLARLIWQALFRELKAHEWKNLDSLLCDLYIFADYIDHRIFLFYFEWCNNKTGWTETRLHPESYEYYSIEILHDEIQLTYHNENTGE